mmetsp:Transcript_9714/g.21630  ORF Transcript_9714/g.21630 Transcript_9714/m.21630 type:complete len:250 (+) Transcript_9714:1698-2447(+)
MVLQPPSRIPLSGPSRRPSLPPDLQLQLPPVLGKEAKRTALLPPGLQADIPPRRRPGPLRALFRGQNPDGPNVPQKCQPPLAPRLVPQPLRDGDRGVRTLSRGPAAHQGHQTEVHAQPRPGVREDKIRAGGVRGGLSVAGEHGEGGGGGRGAAGERGGVRVQLSGAPTAGRGVDSEARGGHAGNGGKARRDEGGERGGKRKEVAGNGAVLRPTEFYGMTFTTAGKDDAVRSYISDHILLNVDRDLFFTL